MRRIALVSLLCLAVAGTARGEGGWTPLHDAVLDGDVAAIKALLDAGAAVNAKAEEDLTPLHSAAFTGHPAAIRALLDAGADVTRKDRKNKASIAMVAGVVVGRARLARQVRHALQDRSQITLREVCELHPLEQGLAELVAYLQLAGGGFEATVDETVVESVFWRSA